MNDEAQRYLEALGVDGLKQRLEEMPGQIRAAKVKIVGLRQRLRDLEEELSLEEIAFEMMWKQSNGKTVVDPTTGKSNKDFTEKQLALAKADDTELEALRSQIRGVRADLEGMEVELSFLLDVWSALRHIAKLTAAELAYVASAPGR